MSASGYVQTKKQRKAEARALKSQKLRDLYSDNTVMFNRMKEQEKQLKDYAAQSLQMSNEKRALELKVNALTLQQKISDERWQRAFTWKGLAAIAWLLLKGTKKVERA